MLGPTVVFLLAVLSFWTCTAIAAPFAYIPDGGNSVSVVDTSTNTVVAVVPVGTQQSSTRGVAANSAGTRVYVVNDGFAATDTTVSVIDTSTNTVVAVVPVGTSPTPSSGCEFPLGVAVNPAGSRVYVNCSTIVSVIDTSTNTVVDRVPAVPGNLPGGAAVNPAGTRLYVAVQDFQLTAVIDTATNRVVSSVFVGVSVPIGVAVNPAGTRVYVANSGNQTVSVIDTGNNTVVATVHVGLVPIGIAVNPAGTRVYVANSLDDSISVIDTATNTVVATVKLPTFSEPIGVAVNPAGSRVYVANHGAGASVIDTATNQVVATVAGATAGRKSVGAFISPGSAPAPALQLTATVNQSAFTVGQTLTTSMTLNNPGLSGSADLCLGVLVPDGSTIVFFTGGGNVALGSLADLRSFRPYTTGVSLAASFVTNMPNFFSYHWAGGEPSGAYVFFNLATRAGALASGMVRNDDILGLATASFAFSPDQTTPVWTHLTAATPNGFPLGRQGSQSTAYDANTDRLIVFGGFADPFNACCGESQDTWVLSNATGTGGTPTWIKLAPTGPLPPGRRQHSAVYDPVTNRMIIFGGGQFNGSVFSPLLNDVWVLKNANGLGGTPVWVQLAVSGGPPAAREGHAAAYNRLRNEMVIFGGGNNGIMSVPNDLWVLTNANQDTGAQWRGPLPQTGEVPPPIEHFAAAYDPTIDALTIAGGCCGYTNATRLLTNATGASATPQWMNLAPGGPLPPVGDQTHFGYDQGSNRLITQGPVPGGAPNATWLLTSAISTAPIWVNSIPGNAPGSPPADGVIITGSAYNAAQKKFVLTLYHVLPGNPLLPEVWILSNANQP